METRFWWRESVRAQPKSACGSWTESGRYGMGTSLEGTGMGTSLEGMGMGTSLEGME